MTQFLLVYRKNSPQPENEILEGGPCRGAVTQPYRATLKHGTLSTREPASIWLRTTGLSDVLKHTIA